THRRLSNRSRKSFDPIADANASCLLSTVGTHRLAAARRANIAASVTAILHDIIPIDAPVFFSVRSTARFKQDLEWMLRECSRVICVSEFTAARLSAFITRSKAVSEADAVVNRLGSFLQSSFGHSGATPVDWLEGKSFVLYCATFEVRKNHICLLKV